MIHWFAKIRKGLTCDPNATHYKAMGNALWLYIHLHQVKDRKTEEISRKVQTICNEMGIPRRTIEHWLKRLRDEGYIEVRRGRASLNIKIVKNPGKTQPAKSSGTGSIVADQTANNGGTQPPDLAELVSKNGNLNGRKIRGKDDQTANNGGTIKNPLIKTQNLLSGKPDPAKEIIQDLNQKSGRNFRHTTQATQRLINARIREGFTVPDFKSVNDNKIPGWINDPKMKNYIRPETLYAASHFDSYLNEQWPESTESVRQETEEEREAKTRAVNQNHEQYAKNFEVAVS